MWRYTTKNGVVYAITLGRPTAPLHLKSLGTAAGRLGGPIVKGRAARQRPPATGTRPPTGLDIEPNDIPAGAHTVVYRNQPPVGEPPGHSLSFMKLPLLMFVGSSPPPPSPTTP